MEPLTRCTQQQKAERVLCDKKVISLVIKAANTNAAAIMDNNIVCGWIEMVRWRAYTCSIPASSFISSLAQTAALTFVESRLSQSLLLNCYYKILIGAWKTHCMWVAHIEVHWTIRCAMYETMKLLLIEIFVGAMWTAGLYLLHSIQTDNMEWLPCELWL